MTRESSMKVACEGGLATVDVLVLKVLSHLRFAVTSV